MKTGRYQVRRSEDGKAILQEERETHPTDITGFQWVDVEFDGLQTIQFRAFVPNA